MKILVLICVAGLLSSCSSLTKSRIANVEKVQPGQTRLQVTEYVGKPDKKVVSGNFETWYYDIYADDNSRVYPYTAKFENGVLRAFFHDVASGAEDRDLREKRATSKQGISEDREFHQPVRGSAPSTDPRGTPVSAPNGAPPLRGTNPQNP